MSKMCVDGLKLIYEMPLKRQKKTSLQYYLSIESILFRLGFAREIFLEILIRVVMIRVIIIIRFYIMLHNLLIWLLKQFIDFLLVHQVWCILSIYSTVMDIPNIFINWRSLIWMKKQLQSQNLPFLFSSIEALVAVVVL